MKVRIAIIGLTMVASAVLAACATMQSPRILATAEVGDVCMALEENADNWGKWLYAGAVAAALAGTAGAIMTSQTQPKDLALGRVPGSAVSMTVVMLSGVGIAWGTYAYQRAREATEMQAAAIEAENDEDCAKLYASWLRGRYAGKAAPPGVSE